MAQGPLLGRHNSPGKLADIGSLSRPFAQAESGTKAQASDVARETVRDTASSQARVAGIARETVRDTSVSQVQARVTTVARETVRDSSQVQVRVAMIVRETVVDYHQSLRPPKDPKQHKALFEGGAEAEAWSEDADEQLWRERAVSLVLLPRLTGRSPGPTWVQLENAAPDDDPLPAPPLTRRFTHLTNIAALARATWHWTANGVGVNSKQVVRFAQRSWQWLGKSPKVNQVVHVAQRSWRWVANGLKANQVIHLARQTWRWTANGLGVNAKRLVVLGQRAWTWSASGIKASVRQLVALAGAPAWRWIARPIGLLLPLKGDPIFTVAAPRQRRLIKFPQTYRTIAAPFYRRIVKLGALGQGMTAGQDIFPATSPQEQFTIPFDFAAGLPPGITVVDCTSPGLGVSCTVTTGTDAAPGSRLIGSPRIGLAPPPLGSNIVNGAVLQRVGNGVPGTLYLLECVALMSNGDTLSLEAHWPVYQPA